MVGKVSAALVVTQNKTTNKTKKPHNLQRGKRGRESVCGLCYRGVLFRHPEELVQIISKA